jgi:hypothetical protein
MGKQMCSGARAAGPKSEQFNSHYNANVDTNWKMTEYDGGRLKLQFLKSENATDLNK